MVLFFIMPLPPRSTLFPYTTLFRSSDLEFVYGLYLLLWGVPNFSVHTRGFLALVFRHSPHGQNFAAERVGQQALQGSHLAPSAFLHRLHDTHLESAHVAVDGLPINGEPLCRFA